MAGQATALLPEVPVGLVCCCPLAACCHGNQIVPCCAVVAAGRFYYQPFDPKVHIVSEPRVDWGIGANGGHAEYDVPRCAEGTPVKDCKHTIWGVVTPGGKDLHLAALHMHVRGLFCATLCATCSVSLSLSSRAWLRLLPVLALPTVVAWY